MSRHFSVGLLTAALCFCDAGFVLAAPADDGAVRLAAKAAGCDLAKGGDDPAIALETLAGPDAALRVVAALTGEINSDGIGDLCVAVVRQDGGRFAKVAALRPGGAPQPPAEVDPTTGRSVSIDKLAFRFMPNETAFAVRASGSFDSTSTGAEWTELYLFRRQGAALSLIFQGQVEDSETDKTATKGGFTDKEFVVRFSPQMTKGAYDLILAPKGKGGRAKRFVWTGARYEAAKG